MEEIWGYALSIIGIFVSVYYAKKVQHKKIKYSVAKKDNEYILVFWNACNHSIFKEDMYSFVLYGDKESECRVEYSNEKEIPLEMSAENDEVVLGCVHKKTIHFSFDFLNKRRGYIVHINNKQESGYVPGKLALYGRIRGESERSIQCYKKLYSGINANTREMKDRGAMMVMNIITIFASISSAVVTGMELLRGINTYNMVLGLIISIVTFWGVGYFIYINSIPFKLNYTYQKFLREKGFREIKSKDELPWWS